MIPSPPWCLADAGKDAWKHLALKAELATLFVLPLFEWVNKDECTKRVALVRARLAEPTHIRRLAIEADSKA